MSNLVPFNPQQIVTQAMDMFQIILDIQAKVLKKGLDYGEIVDGGKPTLLKPGAEKLASAFNLWPDYRVESIVEDWNTGLFFYRYKCVLIHRTSNETWGSGVGSCSTQEEKYGYRWGSLDRVPSHLDPSALPMRKGSITEFEFAIKSAETSGKYGKPQEYWDAFKKAIEDKTAVKGERRTAKGMSTTWSIGGNEYRIPNINVFDTVNTVDKMAQKRALVAAVLVATNASAHFTQDIEDFDTDRGNVLTGRSAPMIKAPDHVIEVTPEKDNTGEILARVIPEYSSFMSEADFSGMKEFMREQYKTGLKLDSDRMARNVIENAHKRSIDMDALRQARKEQESAS